MSRLSRSMLSVASSSEKRVDVGSRGAIHWSGGSPRMGERLPPDNRAEGDPPLILSTTASPARLGRCRLGHRWHGLHRSLRHHHGCIWLVTVMATSACDTGALVCGIAPTTEGTTGAIGGSVRSNVGGRVTSAVVCSVTPEGAS